MPDLFVEISQELKAALDRARRGRPLGPFVENLLRTTRQVRRAADELGISIPERPNDRRGRPRKSE